MAGLSNWLDGQGCGVNTYVAFRGRALEICESQVEHAAAGRLLADLAQQFIESYDSIPLPIDIATAALQRLRQYVAALVAAQGEDEKLALLNQIASERLDGCHALPVASRTEFAAASV
jgi:hypothetical protein